MSQVLLPKAFREFPGSWRLVVAIFSLVALVGLAGPASSAEVGDPVQFERAGQTLTGKVVGIRPGGAFLEVETTFGGQTRKLIVKADTVTVMGGSSGGTMRTWRDASGRFEIEAVLASQTAFDVVLRKKDGSTVKVPLDKLSVADQEYVASLESGGGAQNPFEAGAMNSPTSSSGGDVARAAAGGGQLTVPAPIVFRKSAVMQVQKLSPPKGVTADPTTLDFSQIGNAAMALPKADFWDQVDRPVIVSEQGTDLCYSVRTGRMSDDRFTDFYAIDGKESTTTKLARLPGQNIWLCSADPTSGDVLGVVMKPGNDQGNSLCVIAGMREGNPRFVAHWKMFPNEESKVDHVRYRKILGNQMVIVVYGGEVHAFDYGTKREIWTLKSGSFNEPAITAGGKYAAMMVDKQVVFLETKTGKQIGSIPTGILGAVAMGFSADGLRLAVAQGNKAHVYDVATGEEQWSHEANVPLGGMGKPILWLEDDFLLMPTGLLLSIERDLVVWKYLIDQDAMEYADLEHHGLLTFADKESTSIVRLPHQAAKEAADRDTSNIAAVKKGEAIAVFGAGTAPGVTPSGVAGWLATATTNSGYQIQQTSPTQLIGTVTRGKTRKESYRTMGRGFGTEEVTFTPYICKVELKQNNAVIWQRSTSSSLPFMIHGEKSLQQTAREHEKPNVEFFQRLQLPAQVLKPEYQDGFGTSRVSGTGIADQGR
jgi:hypothetical protein